LIGGIIKEYKELQITYTLKSRRQIIRALLTGKKEGKPIDTGDCLFVNFLSVNRAFNL
jgi:hypothetical protein